MIKRLSAGGFVWQIIFNHHAVEGPWESALYDGKCLSIILDVGVVFTYSLALECQFGAVCFSGGSGWHSGDKWKDCAGSVVLCPVFLECFDDVGVSFVGCIQAAFSQSAD